MMIRVGNQKARFVRPSEIKPGMFVFMPLYEEFREVIDIERDEEDPTYHVTVDGSNEYKYYGLGSESHMLAAITASDNKFVTAASPDVSTRPAPDRRYYLAAAEELKKAGLKS